MPFHSKVLGICLRTKEHIPDTYRGLPVHESMQNSLNTNMLCTYV